MSRAQRLARIWCNRHRSAAIRLLPILALYMAACSAVQPQAVAPVVVPPRVQLLGGNSNAMNYSTSVIANYSFEGPAGTGIGGGGATVDEIKPDGRPSTGGGVCCARYPAEWQPDLKLTVRWLDYSLEGKKVVKTWYKAESVRIPKYDGQQAGTAWVIFLPGDRVRVMLPDGVDPNGGNNPDIRPRDDDPYIALGVPDSEWNEWYPDGIAKGLKQ